MNNQKSIKIEIPEGYEIDKDKSTFGEIIFKPTNSKLPKRWEDLKFVRGYYVTGDSAIKSIHFDEECYTKVTNRNIWPTKQYAEAALALSQLLQLRDVYNDGWVYIPGKSDNEGCAIYNIDSKIACGWIGIINAPLVFKSEDIKDEFLANFKDLIEIALPLL